MNFTPHSSVTRTMSSSSPRPHGYRLLTDDVLARAGRLDHQVVVLVVVRRDEDDLHLRVVDQFLVGTVASSGPPVHPPAASDPCLRIRSSRMPSIFVSIFSCSWPMKPCPMIPILISSIAVSSCYRQGGFSPPRIFLFLSPVSTVTFCRP